MTVIRPNSISGVTSITAQGGNINVFRADGTAGDLTINNIVGAAATFTGVLTYEDVANIDSVGIITARTDVLVGNNIKLGASSGIVTATSFSGSGANLTSLPAANLTGTLPAISGANLTNLPAQATIANNADNRVITGGSGVNLNGESNFTWTGSSLQVTAGTGNQFPFNLRNDFTPNSQRSDLLYAFNGTSNNTLRIGSINSNGGSTIQVTRGNDSAVKHNLILQPDGGNVGINAANPNAKLLIIDDSATQTTILKLRNYKSGVNTKPTLTFEASTSAGQGGNSSIQGLAGTDAGGAANANDSGMKFLVAYGGSGTGREAFTIKKDGNVYFPAGQGIDFSATSDATGMTSELFSDYERGVHTFSVMGSGGNPTVNIQSGYNKLYYTKIGDMVHVTGEMRWTISSHGSGDLKISIPFTSDSSAQSNCQGTAQTWNVNWAWRSESRDLWSEVSPGHNYMRFRIGGSNSLNEDYLDCGSTYQKQPHTGYGVEYQVSLWYRTG